jgi:crossover junction endodeoxyribonuclease RuvC
VAPAIWKKHFGLSTDKDASRALAGQTFPDQADLWKLKKQDGRAEAALIALYGWVKK